MPRTSRSKNASGNWWMICIVRGPREVRSGRCHTRPLTPGSRCRDPQEVTWCVVELQSLPPARRLRNKLWRRFRRHNAQLSNGHFRREVGTSQALARFPQNGPAFSAEGRTHCRQRQDHPAGGPFCGTDSSAARCCGSAPCRERLVLMSQNQRSGKPAAR